MVKRIKSTIGVLFLTLLLLGVPKLAGIMASRFNYQSIDPDGSYAWISVHHILQTLIFIILMVGINKIKPLEYGLGWGDKEGGKKYLLQFFKYFSIYTAGAFITVIVTKSFQQFPYPLRANNIIGQLSFQLLLSGPSEELIFRGFAMTMLALVVKGRIFKEEISLVNLMAAIIFGLAHVGFYFNPFEIRYSLFQVIYSIVLGLFYGHCYEKTNSVFYPMIMHSFTNVVMVSLTIIFSFIL